MSSKSNGKASESNIRFKPLPPMEVRKQIVHSALTGHSRQAINKVAEKLEWPYQTVYSQIDPNNPVRMRPDVERAAYYITRSEEIKNLLLGPEFQVSLNPATVVQVEDHESEAMDVMMAVSDLVAKLREALADQVIDGNEGPEVDLLVSYVDEQWAELKKLINQARK